VRRTRLRFPEQIRELDRQGTSLLPHFGR
jgi:hypothetical protein